MNWFSQAGQDRWVIEMTQGLRGGFFIDLGAYDGVQTSNTYALEKDWGWTGVCVEANPEYFRALTMNRPSTHNIHCAVAGQEGVTGFSGQLRTTDPNAPLVNMLTLESILAVSKAPEFIHYMSMDIEGMELEVLEGFDFSSHLIALLTVEHNSYCDGPTRKDAHFKLLSSRGFERIVEDAPCLDTNPLYYMKPYEDWFANRDFLEAYESRSPRIMSPVPWQSSD